MIVMMEPRKGHKNVFSMLKLRFLETGGGVRGRESDVSMRGGTLLLTYADKGGRGGQKSENFADIIILKDGTCS